MEAKYCYITGDYNMNILNYDIHAQTTEFVDFFYSNGFFPLINRPTPVMQSTTTLIDNIFTNNLVCTEKSPQGLFVTDISDHFPIFHNNWPHAKEESDIYIYHKTDVIISKQTIVLLCSCGNRLARNIQSKGRSVSIHKISRIFFCGSMIQISQDVKLN